jgi:hypothetical protein
MSGRPHYDPRTDGTDWQDPNLRGPSEGWHNNSRADFLREALVQIAECKSLTATSAQFAAHLQRLACKALTADARAEPPASPSQPMTPEHAQQAFGHVGLSVPNSQG